MRVCRELVRRTASVTCVWIAAAGACLAHGHNDPEELGHHWEMPTYLHEMHFQMLAMIAIAALVVCARQVLRVWRARPER